MRRSALDSRTALTEPHNVVAVGALPVSCECVLRRFERHIKPRKACRGRWVILCVAALSMDVAAQEAALPGKFYRIVDGKVDPRTYNGYRLSRGLQPLPRAGRHGLIVWPFACGPAPRY